MSSRLIRLAAIVTAAVVFIAGVVYVIARDRKYESVATVVLAPHAAEQSELPGLLESFERSGTLGTYVELMASDDTTRQARARGVTISVRAVPNTRAIRIVAEGEKDDVQPAIESVIAATRRHQAALSDVYTLEVLETPSEPTLAGPSNGILLLATILLSIFAAVGVVALLRRFAGPGSRASVQDKLFGPGSTRPES